jgi:hypothetical protein
MSVSERYRSDVDMNDAGLGLRMEFATFKLGAATTALAVLATERQSNIWTPCMSNV